MSYATPDPAKHLDRRSNRHSVYEKEDA
eukprot:SAG25_NODE_786_length_5332_cov_175.941525_1_plen_27_part_10